jgi:hypothetical protein
MSDEMTTPATAPSESLGEATSSSAQLPRWTMIAAFVPGALVGGHLALLLFFLNPRLDLAAPIVARGVAVLGLASALAVGVPLLLSLRGRRDRLLSVLPWAITIALAMAAASQWSHAALFAYYLPPGINSRLLKAASGVSLIALICFYTALLHSMQRRRYGWRSRGGFALLAVLSLLLTAERRAAFPPPKVPTSGDIGVRTRPARTNLAVVALEGATLDAILPLAEQGQLPFFDTLLRQGAHGRLRTLSPPLRVAVWESVATGAYPFRHGVVSDRTIGVPFLYPSAELAMAPWGGTFAPGMQLPGVEIHDRPPRPRAPSLWRMLEGAGLSTAMIAWPGEPQRGEPASRWLPEAFFAAPDRAPSAAAIAARALELRPSAESVDPALFASIGDADSLPDATKAAVIQDLWRCAVARQALVAGATQEAPTAVFVGLPGLFAISRDVFGGFAAVQFDGSSKGEQESAAHLVSGYYRFVDRELARLWAALPEPRLMVVVSAHGVREPRHWRRRLSSLSPAISMAGRIDGDADGVIMLLGETVRSGADLDRAALVDVAPTLLYAMGQPVARDGDGRVQTAAFGSAFLNRNPLTFVPSYGALLSGDELY